MTGGGVLGAPDLHSAAVLVFELPQEAVLQLQVGALILHVRLQGGTSHDLLTAEVKQDTFNNNVTVLRSGGIKETQRRTCCFTSGGRRNQVFSSTLFPKNAAAD